MPRTFWGFFIRVVNRSIGGRTKFQGKSGKILNSFVNLFSPDPGEGCGLSTGVIHRAG
jgi:hypothetical protein